MTRRERELKRERGVDTALLIAWAVLIVVILAH